MVMFETVTYLYRMMKLNLGYYRPYRPHMA